MGTHNKVIKRSYSTVRPYCLPWIFRTTCFSCSVPCCWFYCKCSFWCIFANNPIWL